MRSWIFVVLALGLVGCSGGSGNGSNASSSGSSGSPPADTPPSAGDTPAPTGGSGKGSSGSSGQGSSGSSGKPAECNAIAQQGAPYDVVAASSLAPSTGGTIVDGTYVLTVARIATTQVADGTKLLSATGMTMQIAGNQVQRVTTGKDGVVARDVFTLSRKNDTTFAIVPGCPTFSFATSWSYSATPDTLVVVETASELVTEMTFAKK